MFKHGTSRGSGLNSFMVRSRLFLVGLGGLGLMAPDANLLGAERVTLSSENWDAWVPSGKEVDCIYGDIVLRNDHVTAVIAAPIEGRNANMTVRKVGGAVIDLTRRDRPSDQLSAYYPGAAQFDFRAVSRQSSESSAPEVQFRCRAEARDDAPQVDLLYTLRDDQPWLTLTTTYSNPSAEPMRLAVRDSIRADRSFDFGIDGTNLLWASDAWWHQAYGLLSESPHTLRAEGDSLERKRPILNLVNESGAPFELAPGESLSWVRHLIPAAHPIQLQGLVRQARGVGVEDQPVSLVLRDTAGPLYNAQVEVFHDGASIGLARSPRDGRLEFRLAPGRYEVKVQSLHGQVMSKGFDVDGPQTISLIAESEPGYVVARITDHQGRRIACKTEFQGNEGTQDPFWGPDTYEESVHNLVYSAHGQFRQALAPGSYDVIISHGPEYDAVFTSVTIRPGQSTTLTARLRRSVATPGWISSDFHSHSTPSGDNTSSQRGRVLNLLAEQIEFGPCTEHNRISSYLPHLIHLGCRERMATCPGIELTGRPLPVNHQNAFPLRYAPRTQDGGGPTSDENPVVQIERLAWWDQRSHKVVQGNHPNLMQILGDRDLDGQPDGGFERMLAAMDVVEVHPPQDILTVPTGPTPRRERGNVMFQWMQLLNQGYRIPGVVNTDAHYNFHGSGWLRNYLKSSTDDPAQIRVADMIVSAERGHIVMTNGPYLEVTAEAEDDPSRLAQVGDVLPTSDGRVRLHVRVQCANWLNVNRIQIFRNGVADPKQDYRQRTHADLFGAGTSKFDHSISLQLDGDTHVIVVAVGDGLKLGPVVGPSRQDDMPIAVANPVFVDVGSDGFLPNGDVLGRPLPQ